MQVERIWTGLPAPQNIKDKIKKVKDTYTEDAVTFEKDKREQAQGNENPEESISENPDELTAQQDQTEKSQSTELPRIDIVA